MAIGKYLSLEEARKQGKLKEFAEQHPTEGDRSLFNNLFDRMTQKPLKDDRTSD